MPTSKRSGTALLLRCATCDARPPCAHDLTGWTTPMGHSQVLAAAAADEYEPCTCTLACVPQGLVEGQACRLSLD